MGGGIFFLIYLAIQLPLAILVGNFIAKGMGSRG